MSTAICLLRPLINFAGSEPRVAQLIVEAPLSGCESTISVTGRGTPRWFQRAKNP